MSLMQVLAEVRALEQAIDDQLRNIESFKQRSRDHMRLVNSSLQGSTKNYDKRLLATLAQTETALSQSQDRLQQAKASLARVRTI